MTTEPQPDDTKNNLLYKWALALGANPQPADSDNNLLRKILIALRS